MTDPTVDVQTSADGTLVVRPHGCVGYECALELQQTLVHSVRRVRPLRLVLDLADVAELDPVNIGTLAAVVGLADDHRVAVFVDGPSSAIAVRLTAAGVPPQRLRNVS